MAIYLLTWLGSSLVLPVSHSLDLPVFMIACSVSILFLSSKSSTRSSGSNSTFSHILPFPNPSLKGMYRKLAFSKFFSNSRTKYLRISSLLHPGKDIRISSKFWLRKQASDLPSIWHKKIWGWGTETREDRMINETKKCQDTREMSGKMTMPSKLRKKMC